MLIQLVGLENTHTLDIKQLHSTFGLGGIFGKRLVGSLSLSATTLLQLTIKNRAYICSPSISRGVLH